MALFLPSSSALAGTILSGHTYAWSNNVGYINFANVTVGDSQLSGYAWSTRAGFINFSPAKGGVLNDGTGNLSGSAWGESLGWIDFDNVSINSTTGKFSGTATGTLIGTLTFNCNFCDVQTDWPQGGSVPRVLSGSTGGAGATPSPASSLNAQPPPSGLPFREIISDPVKSAEAKRIDIQKDGTINILDFNSLMVNWGVVGGGTIGDMNTDGIVDIFDFNLLMVYWGTTYSL